MFVWVLKTPLRGRDDINMATAVSVTSKTMSYVNKYK